MKCDKCGKEIKEGMQYWVSPNKQYCSNCFIKELEKTRAEWIKKHPCPFKLKWARQHTPDGGGAPRLDWDDLMDVCRIIHGGGMTATGKIIDTNECIGEKNCPIYNGGVIKC